MYTLRGRKINISELHSQADFVESFLEKRWVSSCEVEGIHIHDPFLLPDMQEAVLRISRAFQQKERVMIFGDYDVDGISATAALFLFLRDELWMDVSYRLPHRVQDGYGLKISHIDDIVTTQTKLLITVDCWVRDDEAIIYAQKNGIEVIVTDHHVCPSVLPKCCAIVNPQRKDSLYPFLSLSWAGVVWKLIHALLLFFKKIDTFSADMHPLLQKYLDIIALGTVADCMPMRDENRTIVRYGIQQSQNSHHSFFQTLAWSLSRPIRTEEDIGFFVGPLLNAWWRLTTPYQSIAALLTSPSHAFSRIQDLMHVNETRKKRSQDAFCASLEIVNPDLPMMWYAQEGLEHGVLWLVAAKLVDTYHKPAAVFTLHEWCYVGSFRAPDWVDIMGILHAAGPYFSRYGGHAGAGGCTFLKKDLDIIEKILQETTAQKIQHIPTHPVTWIDACISPEDITASFVQSIENLRPFWVWFLVPQFLLQNIAVPPEIFGKTEHHIQWKNNYGFEILGFHLRPYLSDLGKTSGLIGTFKINTWNNQKTIQFHVSDALLR